MLTFQLTQPALCASQLINHPNTPSGTLRIALALLPNGTLFTNHPDTPADTLQKALAALPEGATFMIHANTPPDTLCKALPALLKGRKCLTGVNMPQDIPSLVRSTLPAGVIIKDYSFYQATDLSGHSKPSSASIQFSDVALMGKTLPKPATVAQNYSSSTISSFHMQKPNEKYASSASTLMQASSAQFNPHRGNHTYLNIMSSLPTVIPQPVRIASSIVQVLLKIFPHLQYPHSPSENQMKKTIQITH